MSFNIGQKVVCIDAYEPQLTKGAVYTVRGVDTCCISWLRLSEVPTLPGGDSYCCYCGSPALDGDWYEGNAFRPLDALHEQLHRIEAEGDPVELEPQMA
jgi:hypothetical protein